jgi:16S rRNA (uracil1498-N3)-methyltransferase
MNRVYCEHIDEPGATVALEREESHHLVRVRRATPGDEVVLFDGCGRCATGRLETLDDRRAIVRIESVAAAPSDVAVAVTVATAVPKGQRMADLVRACTEVGVDRIQPMVTRRSAVRLSAGSTSARWERIAREAAKQSRRHHVPALLPVATFDEAIAAAARHDAALIADTRDSSRPLADALREASTARRVLVLIGPEGGFADDEIDSARAAGVVAVGLDLPVMRVETAASTIAGIVLFALSKGVRP